MADEDSQPEGLEALLQTLDPERQKILLFMLERDHLAALGAELVGPRAFSPEESDTARPPTLLGWTSPDWGDERLPETVPKDAVVRLASEGLAGLRLPLRVFKRITAKRRKICSTKMEFFSPSFFLIVADQLRQLCLLATLDREENLKLLLQFLMRCKI